MKYCDVMPMEIYHILQGSLWQFDRKVVHDGRRSTYTLEKHGHKNMSLPLQDEEAKEDVGPNVLLMSGKELLQEVKTRKSTLP